MPSISEQYIFTEEVQDEFWASLTPNIKAAIKNLEAAEHWSYKLDEFPLLFQSLTDSLPDIVTLPVDDKTRTVIHSLIPLLSSVPYRHCLFAIHWLNSKSIKSPIGWGTYCYLESINIVSHGDSHEQYAMAKVLVDRVTTVSRLRMSFNLFSQWPLKNPGDTFK